MKVLVALATELFTREAVWLALCKGAAVRLSINPHVICPTEDAANSGMQTGMSTDVSADACVRADAQ